MAAILSCGRDAVLSHRSAGALWSICAEQATAIEVSVPARAFPRQPGIAVHRRTTIAPRDIRRRYGIPTTSPTLTLVDLATCLEPDQLEAAVNEADKRDLTDPEALRSALDAMNDQPGVAPLRKLLDRRTFRLTESQLERRFLPIARRAGLPLPQTGRYVSGLKVDFYWPELGLVVETDGLRYHRTPRSAGPRPPPRPDPRGGRAHPTALLTRAGETRARSCGGHPGRGRASSSCLQAR
jgi:hypothetical protein